MNRMLNIYEINTALWLRELSAKYQRDIKLADIPDEEIQGIKEFGFDGVWLMGVWSRSKASKEAALKDAAMMARFSAALADLKEEDISSSPYAIAGYEVERLFGSSEDLLKFKERLNKNGIKLFLDFVANHLALDHPWVKKSPGYFIQGSSLDIESHPDSFFRHSYQGRVFAYGKDPYFPAWKDVAQLNYFNPKTRQAMIKELSVILALCDGLRCDMAMLILKAVQKKIWGDTKTSGGAKFKEPGNEFWEEAIALLKDSYPKAIFIAEVYWGMEEELLKLGFDYVYDKLFYDYLRYEDVPALKSLLRGSQGTSAGRLRFIENHDEGRAISVLGKERSKAAAFMLCLSQGPRLFHQGQLEGFKIRIPVQLLRGPGEKRDQEVFNFYSALLTNFKTLGLWLAQTQGVSFLPAWKGNDTWGNFLGLFYMIENSFYLAVVNYSQARSQCYCYFDLSGIKAKRPIFRDMLSANEYLREKDDVSVRGLYLDMAFYAFHLFKIIEGE